MGKGSIRAAIVYLKSWTNSEQQERNKWQGQNGPRVKTGQEPRCASVVYPVTES